MEANQTDELQTCASCKFFAPNEEGRGWGTCQLGELWPAIPQLTKSDMLACYQAFQKSSWQPIKIDKSSWRPIQIDKSSSKPVWATVGLLISIVLTIIFILLAIILVIPPFTLEGFLCAVPLIIIGILAIIFFSRARS